MNIRFLLTIVGLFTMLVVAGSAQSRVEPTPDPKQIETIRLHPLFAAEYTCSEHFEGEMEFIGDALGADCVVVGGFDPRSPVGFPRLFRTDGKTNEDWYGWREPVLAPFDGVVEKIHVNPTTNEPGKAGKPPASIIILKNADGVRLMIAHVAEIKVKTGDAVRAGQQIAVVGNNGFGRTPHIHIGAWRDKSPLQIVFDLRAKAALRKSKLKKPEAAN